MAQQATPQVFGTTGNSDIFFPLENIDMTWWILSLVSSPYLTPLLLHSPQLTMGIVLMHYSIHLSAHLPQKPLRRYRQPVKMNTSLSRIKVVLFSSWRVMPFLSALFHCMNHIDFKIYRGGHSLLSMMIEEFHIVIHCVQVDRISMDIILG